MNKVFFGDNIQILNKLDDESVDLIYIDPPFNTGKSQARTKVKTIQSEDGDRIGFQGKRYKTIEMNPENAYNDKFIDRENYLLDFLKPRLKEAHRILKSTGSLYFHIDYREVHWCRVLLDFIFGEENFQNEIIWAYDYGGRSKTRWPAKHDNILVYSKNPQKVYFNNQVLNNINFRAPNGKGTKKISPTDSWWHTIVPTNSKKRTGYPTQKPLGILDRIIMFSSKPDDVVLDFFGGSGTTGESCFRLGRKFILIDNNIQSYEVMEKRFTDFKETIDWIK